MFRLRFHNIESLFVRSEARRRGCSATWNTATLLYHLDVVNVVKLGRKCGIYDVLTGKLKLRGGELSQKRITVCTLLIVTPQHISASLHAPKQYWNLAKCYDIFRLSLYRLILLTLLVTLVALRHWSASSGVLYSLVLHVSHWRALHVRCSSSAGQFPLISLLWADVTTLTRDWVPPSHLEEHSLQPLHSLTSHCLPVGVAQVRRYWQVVVLIVT